MSQELARVIAYHQATKHHFYAYAHGPGYLDWATQPDPFRRYQGAPLVSLEQVEPGAYPAYETALWVGGVPPAPLNHHSLSQLLFDSLAISAWKRAGAVSWALRVNPSSGNLHPTEGYVLCGPVDGLCATPFVGHYAPREHALEIRAQFPLETWRALTAGLPANTFLVGLTSIHWREAWKYGERAYRYCQHDVGHAIAAVSMAAAGLGWQATMLDEVGTEQLAQVLGVVDAQDHSPLSGGRWRGVEPEHPDCLLAVHPPGAAPFDYRLPQAIMAELAGLEWTGRPNPLSPSHVDWPIIADVAAAAVKPPTEGVYRAETLRVSARPGSRQRARETLRVYPNSPDSPAASLSLRQVIRQRRSAVAMDGWTEISRLAFYHILGQTLSGPGRFPFNALPWSPRVHLALFVHRVHDLEPGLYMLVRDPAQLQDLRSALRDEFAWQKPEGCPAELDLYRLISGDARAVARQVSCHQEIASDGCFSLGMIADFEPSLQHFGAWFYPRLFWESGVIGQVLYLAAEVAGVRSTGIGCYFDDPMHDLLGLDLKTLRYQSLYHFTIGGPVEDMRLTTLAAYPETKT
jgi:SagB-type dehydrogenase family enzyme